MNANQEVISIDEEVETIESFEASYFVRVIAGCASNKYVTQWMCKLCDGKFSGGIQKCVNHIVKRLVFADHRVAFCSKSTSEARESANKRKDSVHKRKATAEIYTSSLKRHFIASSDVIQNDGDMLILETITVDRLAPNLMDSAAFKQLCKFLQSDKGSSYKLPNRLSLGINSKCDNSGGFGNVLQAGIDKCRKEMKSFIAPLARIGGTLMDDGTKNMKRSTVNSVLQSSKGSMFAQDNW